MYVCMYIGFHAENVFTLSGLCMYKAYICSRDFRVYVTLKSTSGNFRAVLPSWPETRMSQSYVTPSFFGV